MARQNMTDNHLRGVARMKKQPPRYQAGDVAGTWRVVRYAGRCNGKQGHLYDVHCIKCGHQRKGWAQSRLVKSENQGVACTRCARHARSGSNMIIDRELFLQWITRLMNFTIGGK